MGDLERWGKLVKDIEIGNRGDESWPDLMEAADEMLARLAELEAKLDAVKPLMQEIMDVHADPREAEYNECDTDPCMWCEQAKAALAGEQGE